MSNNTISCILPFYNEKERILFVLDVLARVTNLTEIICIDDRSTDGGADKIKEKYPNVKIYRTPKNLGKSGAVTEGLKYVKAPYVLLMDADLSNLNVSELEKGIDYIVNNKDIDMLIFRRKYDPFVSKIFRGDVLVSGERVLRTEDLKIVMHDKLIAYQIESAINYYMQDSRKNVFWMFHSGKNIWKGQKVGLLLGTAREIKFFWGVLTFKGPVRHLKNIAYFCREDITKTKYKTY